MFNKPLAQPIGVAAGQIATITLAVEALTLTGVKLLLGGTTFDKTKIDRIRVKIGSRVLWDLTGTQINAINNYKNAADSAKYLYLDFVERDQAVFPIKEIGGLDLMALMGIGVVTIDIYINAGAVAPTIGAIGYFEQSQGNPAVLKYIPFTASYNVSGKFTLPLSFRGAVLKRLYVFFSGTAWTVGANGNIARVEAKKNGTVFFDQSDLDNRFDQANYKKVPQAGVYVCDFIVDNNHDAHITTMRSVNGNLIYDAFEFNTTISDAGGAALTVVAEVLDAATNL
ncbi:major capsid protein P2 [Undibacterium sp. Ren11W]|uniref:major capsid protein P2 n=1 Tax=Undibacterium sp. Ren11W TaxID=3413045 RepID=UPI003BF3D7E5